MAFGSPILKSVLGFVECKGDQCLTLWWIGMGVFMAILNYDMRSELDVLRYHRVCSIGNVYRDYK